MTRSKLEGTFAVAVSTIWHDLLVLPLWDEFNFKRYL